MACMKMLGLAVLAGAKGVSPTDLNRLASSGATLQSNRGNGRLDGGIEVIFVERVHQPVAQSQIF
jgi:hypothetical protein